MSRDGADACGCFPTGHHYPGIAHLLKTVVRGLAAGIDPDTPWREMRIALIDVETTGRDGSSDRIVEIGFVVGEAGRVVEEHNWLVNPERPIPEEVTAIHGISDADVKDSPSFSTIVREIAERLGGAVPAAYNAPFDKAFVMGEVGRAELEMGELPPAFRRDVEWLDPLVWAREIQRKERSKALGEVAARLGISLERAHRATDDARAALEVMYRLGQDERVPATYAGIIREQQRLAKAQAEERRFWKPRDPRPT